MPRFDLAGPPPLLSVAPTISADAVRIELNRNPWWTSAGTETDFILGLPAPDTDATRGRVLGDLRSHNIGLSVEDLADLRCAWQIVPVGQSRPCQGPRDAAITAVTPLVDRALGQLRDQAGRAGVPVVRDVRCFAKRDPRCLPTGSGQDCDWADARMWCEGHALAPASSAVPFGDERPAALDEVPSSRLALVAAASAGGSGPAWFSGADLGLRFRPLELDFHVLDFHHTMHANRVGFGGDLIGRLRLGGSSADVLAGMSATAAAQNGATNPKFDGLFGAFAGVGYQTRTKWFFDVAQPYISLRGGVVRGDVDGDGAIRWSPMIELHVGLSTPER